MGDVAQVFDHGPEAARARSAFGAVAQALQQHLRIGLVDAAAAAIHAGGAPAALDGAPRFPRGDVFRPQAKDRRRWGRGAVVVGVVVLDNVQPEGGGSVGAGVVGCRLAIGVLVRVVCGQLTERP